MPIESHPDKVKFEQFGSPYNLLSRYEEAYAYRGALLFDNREEKLCHYADSQELFAYLSMAALIWSSSAIPDAIFDTNADEICAEEIVALEGFHKSVTLLRFEITEITQKRFAPFVIWGGTGSLFSYAIYNRYTESIRGIKDKVHKKPPVEGVLVREYLEYAENAYYRSSFNQPETHTILSARKYTRYRNGSDDKILRLSEITKILDCLQPGDPDISLGTYKTSPNKHYMGCYRHNLGYVMRVDEVTALALKKAYLTSDKEKALKYAFVYAILRGYNLRSTIGACWAQELSLRCLFASKNWVQFQKAPGVYLDLAAVLHNYESLEALINAEILSYQASLDETKDSSTKNEQTDSFFVKPNSEAGDFAYYLLINKDYRKEDLAELLFYQKPGTTGTQSSLHIASSIRDSNFFILLEELLDEDVTLCEKAKKDVFSHLNWGEIKLAAKHHEDGRFDLLLEKFNKKFWPQEKKVSGNQRRHKHRFK